MIGGFPHRFEDSFFHQATERLRKITDHKLTTSQFTFGGFPITRVPKHFQPRCLEARPDIVVLQFATSDLIVPIRKQSNHLGTVPAQRNVLANPARLRHWLKWRCRGLLADVLRLPPVTPLEVYLQTMEQLTRTLLDHQIVPVVLSPFVFGGQRSDRFARDCTRRLGHRVSSLPNAVYIDAYTALDQHPRRQMLLSDGTHLSLAGHCVIGDALFHGMKDLIVNNTWPLKVSQPLINR